MKTENMKIKVIILEIDRYIVFPIFFPIFKRFTIIGYRICNIGFTDKCCHLVVVLRIARDRHCSASEGRRDNNNGVQVLDLL